MTSVFLLFLLLCSSGSTLLHQKTSQQCTEMRCPATASTFGVKSLLNEQTLKSEACVSCKQCSDAGYSICLQARDSRANRQLAGGCSCAHSLPQNCDFDILRSTQVVNITMKNFHVCYADVVQAPPKPLAVNENSSVVVTVEPFWLEPYWKSLDLSNLTLIYSFHVTAPEHCDGDVTTTSAGVHTCSATVPIEMDTEESEKKPVIDDDYEHSDNYDEYDDELPPEVQFDRDVFVGAKVLHSHYTVTVSKPRQLLLRERKIVDRTEIAESEKLTFDLKPEVYGTGEEKLPQQEEVEKDTSVEQPVAEVDENDENVSEEMGGTNFFEDDAPKKVESDIAEDVVEEEKPLSKEEKEEEAKETETEVKNEPEEDSTVEDNVVEVNLSDIEPVTEKAPEVEEEEKEEAEEEEKDIEAIEKESQEDVDDIQDDKEVATTSAESSEEEEPAVLDEKSLNETATVVEEEVDDVLLEENGEEPLQWWEHMVKSNDFHRVRLVFLITLAAFILFISLVLCIRNRHICCGKKETKTSNGYRYASAPRSMELVSTEKQSLRQ